MANSDLNSVLYLSVMIAHREMGYLSLPTADKEVNQWQRRKNHDFCDMLCFCDTISITVPGKNRTCHTIVPIEKST